jgi:Domain of unknown function (DUF4440)
MIAIEKEARMRIARIFASAVLMVCACSLFAQKSAEEQAVWKLEHAYWDDVKVLDLESYRSLWHPDFVGWPAWSAKRVRKDHITDWLNAYIAKGLQLKAYELKPADSQAEKNIVVTYYWLTEDWADNAGHEQRSTIHVIHTWIRSGKGWLIIAGMSRPEAEPRPNQRSEMKTAQPSRKVKQC